MSTYQQAPGAMPGWGGAPAPVGYPGLQQTAAPHLRPGERLVGVFAAALDPLLPLYFYKAATKHGIIWAPVRLLGAVLWGFLLGIVMAFVPEGLVRFFSSGYTRRRSYGLSLTRRLYRTIRRPLHGGSWSGGKESMAGRVWQAVRTTPRKSLRLDHSRFTLVLTDQRMLVLSRETGYPSPETSYQAQLLNELPLGTFGLRREVPNSWFTYRLDLAFADGSWIALDMERKDTVPQLSALLP